MHAALSRSGRRPLVLAAAVGVAALAVAAVVVAGQNGGGDHRPSPESPAAEPVTAGPDLAAAPRAAERAVVELAHLTTLPPSERNRRLRELALPTAIEGLQTRVSLSPALEQLTGLGPDAPSAASIVAVAVPLASRLLASTSVAYRLASSAATVQMVTVQVWAVTVLATGRLGMAVACWSTETVQLGWADQRWLVAGYSSRSGPVPLASQPQTGLDSVLAFASGAGGNRP